MRRSFVVKPKPKLDNEIDELPALELRTSGNQLFIGGRPLTIRHVPHSVEDCTAIRRWDKTKRHLLTAEAKLKYEEAATGYNLPKNGKLSIPSGIISETDDKLVFHVERLQDQIKSLKKHMETYDIDDVMTVVVPIDVRTIPSIQKHVHRQTRLYEVM